MIESANHDAAAHRVSSNSLLYRSRPTQTSRASNWRRLWKPASIA